MFTYPILMRIDYADGKTEVLQTHTEGDMIVASALFGGDIRGVWLITGDGELVNVETDEHIVEPGRRFCIEVEE